MFDHILFILAGNDDIHKSLDEFEIWPDTTTGSLATDRVIMEKTALPLFLDCFYSILFMLAGDDDMQASSEEVEFLPDPTTDCGVSCLERLKNPHRLIIGKLVLPRFLSYAWSYPFHTCR